MTKKEIIELLEKEQRKLDVMWGLAIKNDNEKLAKTYRDQSVEVYLLLNQIRNMED